MESFFWQIARDYILPALGTLIGLALSYASAQLTVWLRHRIANDQFQGVTVRLNEAVLQAVLELEQTVVAATREAMTPNSEGGRKITGTEADVIKQQAIRKAKAYLGPKGVALLFDVFGLVSQRDLDKMLGSKVEATIAGMKLDRAAVPTTIGDDS